MVQTLQNLTWSESGLWQQFDLLWRRDPSATALVNDNEMVWSRDDLRRCAFAIAEDLRRSGVRPHDRVMMLARKSATFAAAALAVSQLDAIACPVAPGLEGADLEILKQRLGHAATLSIHTDETYLVEACVDRPRSDDVRNEQAVLIGFTSGTTGVPKAVMHRAGALNYVTRACAANAGLAGGEAILGLMPFDSAAGFTFTVHMALSSGFPLVLIEKWDAVAALEKIKRFGCKWTTGVPTHLFMMIEAVRNKQWHGISGLRTFAVGGSFMTAELIAGAREHLDIEALRMFGMSECLAPCSMTPQHSTAQRLEFDGVPFPHSSVAAFAPSGEECPPGVRGEAGVKGPSLFLGCAEGLGAGQDRLNEGGYYLTGDEIVIMPDGLVRVVGRIKDQIIRGGYNIYPADLEAVLSRHPAVAEAVVVPVPHPKLGEQACAVVRLRDAQALFSLRELLAYMDEAGVYIRKWPEHIVYVDAMATLAGGKIDRRHMARLAQERCSAG